MVDLLHTKLVPPRPRTPLVPRPVLFARLDAARSARLTLLAAPAGFGKTTLAAQWLAEEGNVEGQRASKPSAAWLTLDQSDNEPPCFWRYLIAALQQGAPDVGTAALTLLSAPHPRYETVLTALLNDLAALDLTIVLVLDNYHTITAPAIHETLGWLLERLPHAFSLLVLTRNEPPLPLARLRARGQLAELRARDLRFSAAEINGVLCAAGAGSFPAELLAQLSGATEGWPAGVFLAALALREHHSAEPAHLLAAFGESHQHAVTYLVAEVLDAQSEHLRAFLLETSILEHLTPELCDAVTGNTHSELLLLELERANGLIERLDGSPATYRYHAFFAEALRSEARRRFGPAHLRVRYARASRWYAAHGCYTESIEAALAAETFAEAAALINRLSTRGTLRYGPHTMRRWVEQLPQALLHAYPDLCLAYASAILFSEDRGAPATMRLLERPLELAERTWQAQGARQHLGGALAFRSMAAWWQGEHEHSEHAARQALDLLPLDDHWWRGVCWLHVAMTALYGGRLAESEQYALDARTCYEIVGNQYGRRAATLVLAEIALQRGDLEQAEQLYLHVRAEAQDDRMDEGYVLIGLATIAARRADFGKAHALIQKVLELASTASEWGTRLVEAALLVPALLLQARVLRATGHYSEAQRVAAGPAARTLQYDGGRHTRAIRAEQARLALTLGDLVGVQRWATAAARSSANVPLLQQECEALLVARWLIASGEGSEALRALEHWRARALADERVLSELEIDAVTALGLATAGRTRDATELLVTILPRTRAHGLHQLFVNEAEPMRRLLHTLQQRTRLDDTNAAYVGELLELFPEARPVSRLTRAIAAEPTGEPLSPQEQRVLRLLGAGLSNPEIAEELVVSLNTIKIQVQSIYRKLGVTSRREARAHARMLQRHKP